MLTELVLCNNGLVSSKWIRASLHVLGTHSELIFGAFKKARNWRVVILRVDI